MPTKKSRKYFLTHQYMPKIFHNLHKNTPAHLPTYLMYGHLYSILEPFLDIFLNGLRNLKHSLNVLHECLKKIVMVAKLKYILDLSLFRTILDIFVPFFSSFFMNFCLSFFSEIETIRISDNWSWAHCDENFTACICLFVCNSFELYLSSNLQSCPLLVKIMPTRGFVSN